MTLLHLELLIIFDYGASVYVCDYHQDVWAPEYKRWLKGLVHTDNSNNNNTLM